MTILEKITANKKVEVAARKQAIPESQLVQFCWETMPSKSLKQALLSSATGIISEFKRKSPSKGMIHPDADVQSVVKSYAENGCTGVSVLTDYNYFGGTINDFKVARTIAPCPMLRKDFIVDSYQLYESKILGADVILLIAAVLTPKEVSDFGALAHRLGMEVLLEVHTEAELEYIGKYTDIVGVNNRNLKMFKTDVNTSFDLAAKIPSEYVKISESGLKDVATVKQLREAGFNGFLMGETFMKEANPGATLANFIKKIELC